MDVFIDYLVKAVFVIISGLVTVYVIPWLKDKQLYTIIKQFVQSAEKYAETHDIDKYDYVISHLKNKNIKISATVEALIESAVKELDLAIDKIAEEKAEK